MKNTKQIKNIRLIAYMLFTIIFFASCKKLKGPGVNEPSDTSGNKTWVTNFVHPGILHDQNDLNRIKGFVSAGGFPPMGSYLALKSQATSSASYQIKGPFVNIARDGADAATKSSFEQDFNAAYQNAIMWVITGDETHAKKSIEILNAYSGTLKGITGTNDNALTASLGGFILVNAAEIMRYTYPAWSKDDIAKCETMFRNVFVKELNAFYAKPAYTNGNWGGSVIKAMMGFGVFLNDAGIFNQAVNFYYSKGKDNGSLVDYIINADGQCQESGRDQSHTMLGLGNLAEACEVGYKQHLDMYGASNNRLLAGYEYTAKYNLGNQVPFVKWTDITGKYSDWSIISDVDRGAFSPVFEIVYNAYVTRKKLTMPYTQQVLDKIRPEGAPANSDHPGFGSLLFFTGTTQPADPNLGLFNYQFNTDNNTEGWSAVQAGTSTTVSGGKLKVGMANVGTSVAPKYRADITINKPTLNPSAYPIWAIHFNKPGNSVLTLDTKLGSLSGQGTLLPAKDGVGVYYWDLSTKFSEITPVDYLTLKVADMTTGDPNYEVDWIMTFKSVDDLKAYLNK